MALDERGFHTSPDEQIRQTAPAGPAPEITTLGFLSVVIETLFTILLTDQPFAP